jgi:hypothetical protein
MFRYHHPPRRFGTRAAAAGLPLARDLRLFAGAYLAGAAFMLVLIA